MCEALFSGYAMLLRNHAFEEGPRGIMHVSIDEDIEDKWFCCYYLFLLCYP
jgi:hypothetical protein